MHLDRRTVLEGFPIRKVRNFLSQNAYQYSIDLKKCIHETQKKASEEKWFGDKSDRVLAALLDLGWLEMLITDDGFKYCSLTQLGNKFRCSQFAPPIPRKSANRILNKFLKRVDQVNSNNELPLIVNEVWIFGSMLDLSHSSVNDIDVMVDLRDRISDKGWGRRYWNDERMKLQGPSKGRPLNCYYAFDEIIKILKCHNQYISIQYLGGYQTMLKNGLVSKLLYKYKGSGLKIFPGDFPTKGIR
jgi:hypothetical protein